MTYVSLKERLITQTYLMHVSNTDVRHVAEVVTKLLLTELTKLKRRHGPGECVDIAHVEALIEEMTHE